MFKDNNAAIKRFCRYSLLPHANKPEIHLNGAIIKAMMDDASINGIQADKVFKSAPKIELPAVKFYTYELDKKVVKDEKFSP